MTKRYRVDWTASLVEEERPDDALAEHTYNGRTIAAGYGKSPLEAKQQLEQTLRERQAAEQQLVDALQDAVEQLTLS